MMEGRVNRKLNESQRKMESKRKRKNYLHCLTTIMLEKHDSEMSE